MAIKKQHQAERKKIGEIPFIVKIAKIERQKKRGNKWPRPKKNKLDFHPFLSKCIFFSSHSPLLTSGILLGGPFFSLSDIRCSIYWLPAVVCRWTFSGIIFSAQKKIHHQLEMKNYTHLISRGYTMLVQKWLDLVNCNFFPLLRLLSSCVEGKRIRGFASSFFAVCI